MTISKIIGVLMLATPFVACFVFIAVLVGLVPTAAIFGTVLLVMLWIGAGVHLVMGG